MQSLTELQQKFENFDRDGLLIYIGRQAELERALQDYARRARVAAESYKDLPRQVGAATGALLCIQICGLSTYADPVDAIGEQGDGTFKVRVGA
jgi:hypothetical protein